MSLTTLLAKELYELNRDVHGPDGLRDAVDILKARAGAHAWLLEDLREAKRAELARRAAQHRAKAYLAGRGDDAWQQRLTTSADARRYEMKEHFADSARRLLEMRDVARETGDAAAYHRLNEAAIEASRRSR